MKNTMILGDLHGSFGQASKLIAKVKPEWVIQLGDFGYWRGKSFRWKGCPIYWIRGNHEDHRDEKVGYSNSLLSQWPGITWVEDGAVWHGEGGGMLFVGGANSHDKLQRTIGVDWFENEVPSVSQMNAIYDKVARAGDIRYVFTHDCPESFSKEFAPHFEKDSMREFLQAILELVRPEQWFFGHHHKRVSGNMQGCEWLGLGILDYIVGDF